MQCCFWHLFFTASPYELNTPYWWLHSVSSYVLRRKQQDDFGPKGGWCTMPPGTGSKVGNHWPRWMTRAAVIQLTTIVTTTNVSTVETWAYHCLQYGSFWKWGTPKYGWFTKFTTINDTYLMMCGHPCFKKPPYIDNHDFGLQGIVKADHYHVQAMGIMTRVDHDISWDRVS